MLLSFLGLSWYLWHVNLPLVSPLDVISTFAPNLPFINKPEAQKVVYGFLPYWNMKYSDQIPIRYLTHLAYFGVDLKPDGTIREYDNPGEKEPGANKLNSNEFSILHRQLKLTGKKSILTVRAFDPDQIESIINSAKATQTAISSIMELVRGKQFDGINVDFEYLGSATNSTKDNFIRFVSQLAATCRVEVGGCEINVDGFADSSVND